MRSDLPPAKAKTRGPEQSGLADEERSAIREAVDKAVANQGVSVSLSSWIAYDLDLYRHKFQDRQRMRSPADQRDSLGRVAEACRAAAQKIAKEIQNAPNAFDSIAVASLYLDRNGVVAGGFEGLVAQLKLVAERADEWSNEANTLRSENLHNEHTAVMLIASRWAQITRTAPTGKVFRAMAIALLPLFEKDSKKQRDNLSQAVTQGLRFWESSMSPGHEFGDIFLKVKSSREKS